MELHYRIIPKIFCVSIGPCSELPQSLRDWLERFGIAHHPVESMARSHEGYRSYALNGMSMMIAEIESEREDRIGSDEQSRTGDA
jgi:hypothetical protein